MYGSGLSGFERFWRSFWVDFGRLGGDLRVRRVRSGPVWTVLAVISVDSGRLGGDLRVRRGRSGSVWTVLAVILVESGRLGVVGCPGTEGPIRTGLAPRGAADRRPERLGQRRRTVSESSEGRALVFAPGNARSWRANPTHTQMKLEESKPRRILRSVFGCGWVGSQIHWSCLACTSSSSSTATETPPHTHSRSG